MKERILNYLAAGLSPVKAASIVGCSPSYVSQLCKDAGFQAELEQKILNKPEDAAENDIDTKYQSLEHTVLKAMEDAVIGAELPALTRALEVISKTRDMKFQRKNPQQVNPLGITNLNVISVSLPAHALQQPTVEMNSQGEILAINNRALAPMSSDGVKNLFEQIRTKPTSVALPATVPADY